MAIDKLINDFLHDLENNKKRSWRTVRNYDLYLRRFNGWLVKKNISTPKQVTLELLKEYHQWLGQYRNAIKKINLKKNTQNYHLIALRAFFHFLSRKGIKSLSSNEIKLVLIPKSAPVSLSKIDLEKLLNAPVKFQPEKIIQTRDKAILELIACTGLRVSDIAALRIGNVDLKKKVLKLKDRIIDLSHQATHSLGNYFNLRTDKSDFLFVGHDKTIAQRQRQSRLVGLTARSLERIVEKYSKLSGIKSRVTLHTLRHTYAKNLLLRGTRCDDVQERLGHKAVSTTRRYFITK